MIVFKNNVLQSVNINNKKFTDTQIIGRKSSQQLLTAVQFYAISAKVGEFSNFFFLKKEEISFQWRDSDRDRDRFIGKEGNERNPSKNG